METVERELAKGVGDILSLICHTFVFVIWIGYSLLHLILFRLETRSWALR